MISLDKRADAGNRASLADLDDDDKRAFVHDDAGHVDKTYNARGWNEKSRQEVVDHVCDELDRESPRNEGPGTVSRFTSSRAAPATITPAPSMPCSWSVGWTGAGRGL